MAVNKSKIDYKELVISAAVTALTVAAVNAIFLSSGSKKGLGMPSRSLAFLPLEKQAKFADIVTAMNVNNNKWLVEQLSNVDITAPDFFKGMNNTSIGNCAFIVMHSKNKDARDKCRIILERFKQHVL